MSMSLQRRSFLKLAAIAAAGATASACSPVYARLARPSGSSGAWIPDQERHFRVLSRLTFGPTLAERAEVAEIGMDSWIEAQLDPESLEDPGQWRIRGLDVLGLDADALVGWERQEVRDQLARGTLLRQVYSRRQLYELMVAFWTDHFNISVEKGDCWFLKVVDDREVVRRHALGNFRDLLWASAHSPAMLVYLDNQANHKDAPNENYAREVMELHTVGVDGGYTQRDVEELARCFTGWTVKEHFWRGQFAFDPDIHDPGPKEVVGLRIEPAGQAEAERVLDHLALHPSTARYLATKLVRRFVTDEPETHALELIDSAASVYLTTGGEIRPLVKHILEAAVLPAASAFRPKLKRPAEFVVSALRMLETETDCGSPTQQPLAQMGQPPFGWPTPDGPPDVAAAWSGALLPRWQFALNLSRNELPGTRIHLETLVEASGAQTSAEALRQTSRLLLGTSLPLESERRFQAAVLEVGELSLIDAAAVVAAGLVASPAFQWR